MHEKGSTLSNVMVSFRRTGTKRSSHKLAKRENKQSPGQRMRKQKGFRLLKSNNESKKAMEQV